MGDSLATCCVGKAPAVLSLVPPEALESQRLQDRPAESNSDKARPRHRRGRHPPRGAAGSVGESAPEIPAVTLTLYVSPQLRQPPYSAASIGRTFKACDELKAEIQAKLVAKRITGYTLIIIASGDLTGQHIVGSCEGNTKRLYTSAREMRRKTPGSSQATATHSALAQVQEVPGPSVEDDTAQCPYQHSQCYVQCRPCGAGYAESATEEVAW